MKFFRKEMWSYAVLLLILFCIATIAVIVSLQYFESITSTEQYRQIFPLIWLLTLGFMLIAGAFGLWAINFSAEKESRLRVGRFVDAMDYFSDALLTIDHNGRITGSNPATRKFTSVNLEKKNSLQNAFDCLNKNDVQQLLNSSDPDEIEKTIGYDGKRRTLRFRSQPSEGLILVLVSDVTATEQQRIKSRKATRLQLIGHIARGVANDFNNLLCGISGHASLLARSGGNANIADSCKAIAVASDRGIRLAGQLLELSEPGSSFGNSTVMIEEHINAAADALKNALPGEWDIQCQLTDTLPPVGISGFQLEQIITNLGLVASDSINKPGILRITVKAPENNSAFNEDSEYAGVILVGASSPAPTPNEKAHLLRETSDESGVLESVIQSLLEETGGGLDLMCSAEGAPVYRIKLPVGNLREKEAQSNLTEDLQNYIKDWHVLLAGITRGHEAIAKRLKELGVEVYPEDDLAGALAIIEKSKKLEAIIVNKNMLGRETNGILKAITKLRPSAGIAVISEYPESQNRKLMPDIKFLRSDSEPDTIIASVIEARTLAQNRKKSIS